jgi:hypothetical protein
LAARNRQPHQSKTAYPEDVFQYDSLHSVVPLAKSIQFELFQPQLGFRGKAGKDGLENCFPSGIFPICKWFPD